MVKTQGVRSWFTAGLLGLLIACTQSPSDQAAAHRVRGDEHHGAGRYREASIEYQAALQKWPQDVEARYGLARTLDALGQPGEQREALAAVLRLDPGHLGANVDLGNLYWAAGAPARALELAERALVGAPGSRPARKLRAKALAAQGRSAEAAGAWDEVLAEGGDEEAYVEAASLAVLRGEWARAEGVLRVGLGVHPGAWRLWVALADLEAIQGRVPEAEAALARAEAAAPREPQVAGARARWQILRGRGAEGLAGLRLAEEAAAGTKELATALARERARILVELGAVEDAEGVLRARREQDPSDPHLAAGLAHVLLLQQRPTDAQSLLPLARGADPQGRTARQLEAWIYLLDGRPHWALALLEGLLAGGDLTVETRLLHSRALLDLDRLGEARVGFEAILRRSPDHFFARLDLVAVLRAQREYEAALGVLGGLKKPWSETPPAQFLRARLALDRGDLEAASRLATMFLSSAPENSGWLALMGDVERARGRGREALAWYRKAQTRETRSPSPMLAEVGTLQELGMAKEARSRLAAYLAERGETPDLLNRLAVLHRAAGDGVSAFAVLERSVLLEPNFWETRFLRARLLLERGEETKALVELEEATKVNPVQGEAYQLLGWLYEKRGEWQRAEETYRRHLGQKPGDPLTANNLACLLADRGRLEEALPLARLAYQGAPRSPAVLDTLGWVLYRLDRREEAAPHLAAARELAPKNPDILLHWALHRLAGGDAPEALAALREVEALAPGSETARLAREELARRVPAGEGKAGGAGSR